jgi:hypothetical protein
MKKVIKKRIREDRPGLSVDADVNAVISANVGKGTSETRTISKKGGPMAEHEYQKLSREELNELAGEELPERAAMSLINANVAAPVNLAAALNVLSDDSIAIANAEQTGNITQSN